MPHIAMMLCCEYIDNSEGTTSDIKDGAILNWPYYFNFFYILDILEIISKLI